MSSFSEPNTPLKENLGEKWETASCSDIGKDVFMQEKCPLVKAKFTALRHKREAIEQFLNAHKNEDLSIYIDELRNFAISPGGLVDDEFRAIIWPILSANLLSGEENDDVSSTCDSDFESAQSDFDEPVFEDSHESTIEQLKKHKEWNQVELDVNRTLARFPPNISDIHREILQTELIPLIVQVLSINPRFNYYQGFHDICLTILLVCGKTDALKICSNLARNGVFNNYLLKTLEKSVVRDLDLMYVLLSRIEPQLEKVMSSVELGSIFALSWPLTWLSHSLQQYQQIVRFFDCFLASIPLLPIYVSAIIVLCRKASILSCEREMPFIHRLLTEMPRELPIDAIIKDAVYLSILMPPVLLKKKYAEEYRKKMAKPPKIESKTLPRYALQFIFVAGTVGAAAGFFIFKQINPV